MSTLKKYPLSFLFFGFLAIMALVGFLAPSKATSSLENRSLTQAPVFTVSSPAPGSTWLEKYQALAAACTSWTMQYNEFTKDQLPLRDNWISLQSMLESAQFKLENGGVWYAKDNYLIAKNSVFTHTQQLTLPVNTQAVTTLAQQHPGKVSLMVVPSPANTLNHLLRWHPPTIDENALLDQVFATTSEAGATVIDLRPAFNANLDDSLYYRTDHHWATSTGAWLAYEAYAASQNFTPLPMPEATRTQVPGFLGTNFAKSKKFNALPDTLEYYNLPLSISVSNLSADGTVTQQTLPLMNQQKLEGFDKYGAFIQGNNGYTVIPGQGQGKVLVVKDSYGNSFVPYLTQNYAQVGVIDLRLWPQVNQTFLQDEYDEILVLYSFDNFSQDPHLRKMVLEAPLAA